MCVDDFMALPFEVNIWKGQITPSVILTDLLNTAATMAFEVNIKDARSGKTLSSLTLASRTSTILDVKKAYAKIKPSVHVHRQSYRIEPKGKMLKDSETLANVGLQNNGVLFLKDLGPQVGWTTVFLTEYAGPLFIYVAFYMRPSLIYGASAAEQPKALVVNIAAACWTFHYAKRLFETVFIHRFSHATMPIANIVKNSIYYWGFAAFVAYFMNHPLYTSPGHGNVQIYAGLTIFTLGELGNFSIHLALRNLRPAGSKERKIPYSTTNPFTWMFKFVSCPNYSYEAMSWMGFSIMTQCLPVAVFTLAGFAQMAIWAGGKHRNYLKEFKNYPRGRKPIVPFLF